jgi:hypothetical protein
MPLMQKQSKLERLPLTSILSFAKNCQNILKQALTLLTNIGLG